MNFKQAILVRMDLKMPKGKLAGQVAHASLEAALIASDYIRDEWRSEGAKKVVLKVESIRELKQYEKAAQHLTHATITDAAKTFFSKPTVTCLAIGPASEAEIDKITSGLHLL
jgi:PTH2 family peptidyl-tRNA hydrolase